MPWRLKTQRSTAIRIAGQERYFVERAGGAITSPERHIMKTALALGEINSVQSKVYLDYYELITKFEATPGQAYDILANKYSSPTTGKLRSRKTLERDVRTVHEAMCKRGTLAEPLKRRTAIPYGWTPTNEENHE